MLSINAFNALLKTLEEPPDHAKFIFATTEPHKIPVTILSRCQRFDFRKIALPKVSARLREIVDAERIEISDRSLALVARRGEGSMRDALSTLDQVIAFCGESVADADVQGLLGMVDRRILLDTVEGVVRRDGRQVLDAVRRVDDLGHSYRQFCQELVELFRALVLCLVLEQPGEQLDVTEDELAELRTLAEGGSLDDHQRALTLLVKCEGELASSSFPRLTLEMALVRLTQLPAGRDVGALVRKLEELERALAGSGGLRAPARPPQSAPPEEREAPPPKKPEAPAPSATGGQGWQGLVEHVKGSRPMLASLLEHGRLLSLELPLLEVGFPAGSFHLEQVKDVETLASLHELASGYFGQPVTIKVAVVAAVKGEAPPTLIEERRAQESDRKKRLREDALAHPMVKAAIDVFGGEVKEVRAIDKGFV